MRHHRVSPKSERSTHDEALRMYALTREAGPTQAQPESLHHVLDQPIGGLEPGDVVVLGEFEELRQEADSDFYAVIACPRCGALDLITSAQYFGGVPVICGSHQCSCSFRIEDEARIVYLPLN